MSNLIDIGKEKIDIACPSCGRKHKVLLKDVERQITVRCGCGTDVKLVDKDGSMAGAIRRGNRALDDLQRTWNKLGKVKIKI